MEINTLIEDTKSRIEKMRAVAPNSDLQIYYETVLHYLCLIRDERGKFNSDTVIISMSVDRYNRFLEFEKFEIFVKNREHLENK